MGNWVSSLGKILEKEYMVTINGCENGAQASNATAETGFVMEGVKNLVQAKCGVAAVFLFHDCGVL